MKYYIIVDGQRGFEYIDKLIFNEALSWYRDPANGYLGRIQVIIEDSAL